MSHNSTSPELRSRKSRMVPRVTVSHESKEHQLGESTAMEQEDRNWQVAFAMHDGGDHVHTKTFLGHSDNTTQIGHRDSASSTVYGESATSVAHSQRLTQIATQQHNPVPASSQDPSTWCNGQTAETSFSTGAGLLNEAEADDGDRDESDDDDGDSSDRRPLLSGGESGGGRMVDGVEVENEVVGEVIVQQAEDQESSLAIMLQVLLPYLIAGFGMVGAGMVLDVVQHNAVFTSVSELFILVPALLGLKGNLEMTLASRLSTQANLGNMDLPKEKFKMIGGNMALIQAQATVVGFLASMFAMVMGWIPKGEFPLDHALLLCASSLFTAAVASFVLGSLMVGVVLLSRKLKVNPDNVATPIAASLGDLITLSLLAGVGSVLYTAIGKQQWLSPVIMAVFFALLPLWVVLSVKNRYTNDVIYSGWVPVLSAMVISSLGGGILDFAVSKYHGIAVFQPVINGVGGNLVAVQASRISTYLHRRGRPGQATPGMTKGCANPFTFFCGKGINARAARVLLLLVVPGHLIFIYTIYYMKAGHTSITLLFNLFYLLAAVLQVVVLLYVSQWMVHYIWRLGEDPDNIAIPYLTALGDLLGTAFLAMAFHALYLIGDRDADLGE